MARKMKEKWQKMGSLTDREGREGGRREGEAERANANNE